MSESVLEAASGERDEFERNMKAKDESGGGGAARGGSNLRVVLLSKQYIYMAVSCLFQ